MATNFEKFQKLLEELFQLDQADLDFGIYRIMNQKRDEVVRFLEKDLLPQVKEAFSQYRSADKATLQTELDKLVEQITGAGMDPEDSPKVQRLREQMADSSVDVTALENEVFSHLYSFFRRYYHEGDFISLRRYKEGVYAIPYEGEEVKLHWANHDQYYIKSSEYFRDYIFTMPSGKRVRVHLVAASTEQDNKKEAPGQERRFVLCAEDPIYEENGELFIRFEYRPDDGKKKQDVLNREAIQRVLDSDRFDEWIVELSKPAPTAKNPSRTVLEKHLTQYTARNTFDYFIHKDLGGFLRRELDFYIKNEVMHLDDVEHETVPRVEQYLSKIKVIRRIAHKVIQFLEQLENFQKKLWLKKKFVVETNYCITLNRVPEELYSEIATNDDQREEWVRLFAIDEIKGDLAQTGYSEPLTVDFLRSQPQLPVDTRYFGRDIISRLLAGLSDLDEQTACVAINCDNFHGLQLVRRRLENAISSIYVDPPFNTENNDFLYKDDFQHSSWASMVESRLSLAKELLKSNGSIFVHIDYHESVLLKMLLEQVFGDSCFVNEIIWRRKQATSYSRKQLGITNDTIWWFAKSHEYLFEPEYSKDDEHTQKYIAERFVHVDDDTGRKYMKSPLVNSLHRPNLKYEFHGVTPPPNGWLYSKERLDKWYSKNELVMPKTPTGRIYRKIYEDTYPGQLIQNLWIDIPIVNPMAKERIDGFVTQKPAALVKRIVKLSTTPTCHVLDFFAGSGTTLQAVLDANNEDNGTRRCVLMEAGDHFSTVLVERAKRLAMERTTGQNVRGFIFKYIRLESYEDSLNNLGLTRTEQQTSLLSHEDELREQYILSYMVDVESRGSQSLVNVESFRSPDQYKLKVERNGETQLVNVDLVETFNWLLGLNVKHIDVIRGIRVVEGTNPDGERVLILWRNYEDTDNDALDKWFAKQAYNTKEQVYDVFYVNGDNNLENLRRGDQTWKVRLIEEEFQRLMFDVQDV